MVTDVSALRYIVFYLNPDVAQYLSAGTRIDTHDGDIHRSLSEARELAMDAIKNKLCTRFIIGVFVWDALAERISISAVESYGFRNDKKIPEQLVLFTNTVERK